MFAMYLRDYCAVVLVLTVVHISNAALDPAPKSLIYVIGLYRHGIRTPASYLPGDPNIEKYHDLGYPGALTIVGKRQMFFVGKSLRERYGSFLGDYHKDKVQVTTTSSSRTLMSALSVMAGLFPPTTPIFRGLPWQPIPVWQDTHDIDKSYVLHWIFDQQMLKEVCPKYANMLMKPLSKFIQPDVRPENKPLYEYVQKHAKNSKIVKAPDLYNFYDRFYFAKRNGLTLPSWATDRQKEFQDRALFPDVMSGFNREYMETLMYFEKNKEMLDIFAGPMLDHISSDFLAKGAKPGLKSKFHYHSTHDTVVYPILRALEVDEPLIPEPGDGLIFELHLENNQRFVKILFHVASTNSLQEVNSPLCPNPCPLVKFATTFRGLNKQQWKMHCEL